jgi:hypothetical protein
MQTNDKDPGPVGRDLESTEKDIPIQGCVPIFLGEQRSAERSGAPAHQAQDKTAGPREQGLLSGQAFSL